MSARAPPGIVSTDAWASRRHNEHRGPQPIDDRRPAGREQDEPRRAAPVGSGATLVGSVTPAVVGVAGRGSPAVCAVLTTEVRRAVPSVTHGAHEARRVPPPAAESRPNRLSVAHEPRRGRPSVAHEPRRRRLPAVHEPRRGGGEPPSSRAPSPVAGPGRGSSASMACSAVRTPCSVRLSERKSMEPVG